MFDYSIALFLQRIQELKSAFVIAKKVRVDVEKFLLKTPNRNRQLLSIFRLIKFHSWSLLESKWGIETRPMREVSYLSEVNPSNALDWTISSF